MPAARFALTPNGHAASEDEIATAVQINADKLSVSHECPSVVLYSKKLTFASNRWIEKPVLEEDGRDASYT
jgi:hypothetical protein